MPPRAPSTPLEALASAAQSQRARLVWLSVSSNEGLAELRSSLPAFASELQQYGASVIVGGQSADRLKIGRHPNLFRGASLAELGAFAQGTLTMPHAAANEANS